MEMYLMILQTLVFVAAWGAVGRYVETRGPIASVRSITLLNSRFYSLASAALLALILLAPAYQDTARLLFHASKFYEYIDVLGVRAAGGEIDLHFGFHHLTTPYLTYFRVLHHHEGWRIVAGLNTFHHVLMYAYFGGAAALRSALPVTGTLQLVAGIAGEAWMLTRKTMHDEVPLWPNAFTLGLLSTYLVLWIRDLRMRSFFSSDPLAPKSHPEAAVKQS
ncbi:NADPH2:quinone reductase [Purpureocillium lilacinum]|uniref:NADPH2:quinone reductase n=1 Tax=Purpureocillium lilacinum TaxID=33203 RepID=A0A179HS16_PURLI|nr:NADPH2:quinone reductase [Purpureocillium lilacinum]OAQ92351.1 NADPH2:quinone reductase [Purpureocillium lilacinum]